jgi:KaiC/GvpD/RAD55 family RecA-like ATPase
MRAIGITEFLGKTFEAYEFKNQWLESFGMPEKNFDMSITGESGGGKTEFSVQFTKMMAEFTKVDYFSFEQGISKSLQDAIKRNDMASLKGKVMFIGQVTFDDLILRLKRKGSAKIVIIDSQDYSDLTTAQYKILKKTFPKKSFVIISWSKGDKPKNQAAKDIEYMSCIKVLVKNFKAFPRSRFGGNKPFIIWDKKDANPVQGQLF